MLEVLNRKILRAILRANSKLPSQMLYLETGAIPIAHVISVKRLVYFQNILKKQDDDIIKKVYLAQKSNPSNVGWFNDSEKENYILNISDDFIEAITENKYKSLLKQKVAEKEFEDLKLIQNKHSKVKKYLIMNFIQAHRLPKVHDFW